MCIFRVKVKGKLKGKLKVKVKVKVNVFFSLEESKILGYSTDGRHSGRT